MGSSEDSPVRDWTEEERRKATGETNKDRVERFLQDNHPMLAAYSTDLYRRRLTTLLDEAVRDALLQKDALIKAIQIAIPILGKGCKCEGCDCEMEMATDILRGALKPNPDNQPPAPTK